MSDELKQAAERLQHRATPDGKHEALEADLYQAVDDGKLLADAYLAEIETGDFMDAARPSWWRGNDHGIRMICALANLILDGKDDGSGVAGEPWESTRRRLLAMKAELDYRLIAS